MVPSCIRISDYQNITLSAHQTKQHDSESIRNRCKRDNQHIFPVYPNPAGSGKNEWEFRISLHSLFHKSVNIYIRKFVHQNIRRSNAKSRCKRDYQHISTSFQQQLQHINLLPYPTHFGFGVDIPDPVFFRVDGHGAVVNGVFVLQDDVISFFV